MALQSRKYVRLIDANYLYATTYVDDNVDAKLINQAIDDAQEIWIQQVLGHDLYNKIMSDCFNETITGNYYNLLNDYVLPALSLWAQYNLIPYLNWKFTNKSVAERTSDTSNPADMASINYLREDVKNRAEFLTKRITEIILNNQESFPEYFTTSGIAEIKPARSSYFSGISLPNSTSICDYGGPCSWIRIK